MCKIKKIDLLRVLIYTKGQGLAAEGTWCQMGKTLKWSTQWGLSDQKRFDPVFSENSELYNWHPKS